MLKVIFIFIYKVIQGLAFIMYLGFHVSKGTNKTTYDAIVYNVETYDINAIQIYVMVPRQHDKVVALGGEAKIKKFVKKNNIKLYIHTTHLTGPMVWAQKPFGIKMLKDEMKLAKACGASGVVVHLPKKCCKVVYEALSKYKEYINGIKVRILFEMPAAKPDSNCTFETPDKLNKLTDVINKVGLKKWGYCIDTAHIYTTLDETESKKYNLKTYSGMGTWLKGLSNETRKKIKLIHLNGSHSHNWSDVHAIPIFGTRTVEKKDKKTKKITTTTDPDFIWGYLLHGKTVDIDEYKHSGLYRIVNFARSKKIPLIMERNFGTKKQMLDSIQLIKDN
jgi:endonuclease IV